MQARGRLTVSARQVGMSLSTVCAVLVGDTASLGGMLVRYIRVQVGIDKGGRHMDWEWTKYVVIKGHWCRPHCHASWEHDLSKISRLKFAHFMVRYFTSHQKT